MFNSLVASIPSNNMTRWITPISGISQVLNFKIKTIRQAEIAWRTSLFQYSGIGDVDRMTQLEQQYVTKTKTEEKTGI